MTPHDATKHTLLFQTQDPVLKNVKLRQAIAAALDIPQVGGGVGRAGRAEQLRRPHRLGLLQGGREARLPP